ncbi:response regulator [Pollutibacter soli]|uniref:response regulator n=1 Tax=Pollutibacter soli TaxID=3034157 RepID=UPI00301342E2
MGKFFILVAEDDADDRFLLQTAFQEQQYGERIDFVQNGVELLSYLDSIQQNKHVDTNFPVFILLDLNMPKKDGREVLQFIKQHPVYKRIPVIIFTTTKSDNEVRKCYELGANTYVVKPTSFDGLITVLSEIRSYWLKTATVPA